MIAYSAYEREVDDLLDYLGRRLGSARRPDFVFISRDSDGTVHFFVNDRRAKLQRVGAPGRPHLPAPWWERV